MEGVSTAGTRAVVTIVPVIADSVAFAADLFAGAALTPLPLSPSSCLGVLISSRVRVSLGLRAAQAA